MSQIVPRWDLRLSSAPQLHDIRITRDGSQREAAEPVTPSYELHFYKCEGTLLLDGARFEIAPGSVSLVPSELTHERVYQGRAEHLSARFSLRGDAESPTSIAALQDLGQDFMALAERFEHAARVFPAQPAQAEARLWDVLWELAERTAREEAREHRRHAALIQACRVIQSRISEPLSLSALAAPSGVSPAHLTRLFRAELGLTATEYLRQCRLERALRLLTRSAVPIKEVACEVGIPDLHAFNKAVRRGYGLSPRELRARGAAPQGLSLRRAVQREGVGG